MKTYQVTLPDEVAAFVDRVLAEKLFDDFDNLIVCALSSVEAELEIEKCQDIDALRKASQIGIDQLDRGEGVDGEEVMARLRAKLEAARKQPA